MRYSVILYPRERNPKFFILFSFFLIASQTLLLRVLSSSSSSSSLLNRFSSVMLLVSMCFFLKQHFITTFMAWWISTTSTNLGSSFPFIVYIPNASTSLNSFLNMYPKSLATLHRKVCIRVAFNPPRFKREPILVMFIIKFIHLLMYFSSILWVMIVVILYVFLIMDFSLHVVSHALLHHFIVLGSFSRAFSYFKGARVCLLNPIYVVILDISSLHGSIPSLII